MPFIAGTLSLAYGLGSATAAIKISWPSFTDSQGNAVVASSQLVNITDGTYGFFLSSNQNSVPFSYYTATYFIGLDSFTEHWVVPDTNATLSIKNLQQNQAVPPPPFAIPVSQLYDPTATIGQVLVHSGTNFVPTTLQSSYPFTFNSQQNLTIPLVSHNQGTALVVRVYDSAGNELDPAIVCDPVTGLVSIYLNDSTTGYGFIYGGLGRSLPNFSASYINQQSVTVTKSQHHFGTNNLLVVLYDQVGNHMSGVATVQVTSDYDVNISISSPTTFKVVIMGAIGAASASTSGQTVYQPYTATITNQTSWTIPPATHGKGQYGLAFCFTSTDPATPVTPTTYSRGADGTQNFTFASAFSGLIQVI